MIFTRKFRKQIRCFYYILFIFILSFSISSAIYESLGFDGADTSNCSHLCPYSSVFTNDTLYFDASHIRHFPSFVCPQNFRNLADWIYGWPDQFLEHIEVTSDRAKRIAPCLPSGSIIYVRIWIINEFFAQVYPYLQNKFVLITGEGDMSSPIYLEELEAPNSKIIHWFGQNGQYDVVKSRRFTHIPIGINCYEMADAIQNVYSQHTNHKQPRVFNDLDEPSNYIQLQDVSHRALTTKIPNKDLVLINLDPGTDRTGLRSRIVKDICSKANGGRYSFVKCISKRSGVQIKKLSQIYERNRQYPFWLSPRGNGIDCHRTWEALYLDIIPIVWNSSLNVLYENLPVVIINDHEELNETFLYETLGEISRKKLSKDKVYKFEKLYNAYWRRLILDKSRHRENENVHKRTNQCWTAMPTTPWRKFLPFW